MSHCLGYRLTRNNVGAIMIDAEGLGPFCFYNRDLRLWAQPHSSAITDHLSARWYPVGEWGCIVIGAPMDESLYRNRKWLKEQYHDKQLTAAQIADIAGVSKPTILNWMCKFGIPRRNPADIARQNLSRVCEKKRVAAVRKATLGVPRSKETRKKISRGHVGIRPNKETRKKQSWSHKRFFADNPGAKDLYREFRLNQQFPQRDTSIELVLQDELRRRGVGFQTHRSVLDLCIPDILIPEKKIVIQADGDYWHGLPEVMERDALQNAALTRAGYKVFRFKGSEIEASAAACIDRVTRFMKGET